MWLTVRAALGPAFGRTRDPDLRRPSVDGSVGFTYGTLEGHSERGLATFAIDPDGGDGLRFRIATWSSLDHFRDHFREPEGRWL
jgi:uncharacterized protein (UPF0548 family)